jgi:hypothetical protein
VRALDGRASSEMNALIALTLSTTKRGNVRTRASDDEAKKSFKARNRSRFVFTKFGGWTHVDPNDLETRAKKHIVRRENVSENFLDDVVDYNQRQK